MVTKRQNWKSDRPRFTRFGTCERHSWKSKKRNPWCLKVEIKNESNSNHDLNSYGDSNSLRYLLVAARDRLYCSNKRVRLGLQFCRIRRFWFSVVAMARHRICNNDAMPLYIRFNRLPSGIRARDRLDIKLCNFINITETHGPISRAIQRIISYLISS